MIKRILPSFLTSPNVTINQRSHTWQLYAASVFALLIQISFAQTAKELPNKSPLLVDSSGAVSQLSFIGKPKYPIDFTHVNYVNPHAPKGGTIKIAALSRGFDKFNPYIVRGNSPQDMELLWESLTTSIADDTFAIYGLLAEKFLLADDKLSMTFYLNPKAHFNNGDPVTADDVTFSYNILIEKGIPQIKLLLKALDKIEKIDDLTVKFIFKNTDNPKLPFVIGSLPIYQQKDFNETAFDEPTLAHIPNTTGPYKVGEYDNGRFIEYTLDPHYWAKDLPIKRGQHNFNTIRYEFYFDSNAALEAFKSGQLDIRHDASPRVRATMYESKAKALGWYKMESFKSARIAFMQGFVFNLRRPEFQNICVRQALSLMLDIPWAIKNFAYGQYQPSISFFGNSELEAKGKPSPQETAILKAYLDLFPNELNGCNSPQANLLNQDAVLPAMPTSLSDRHNNLVTAQNLLRSAGWTIQDGQLKNLKGQIFRFDMVIPEGFDRLALLWSDQLKRVGIVANIMKMDDVQLSARLKKWNFDATLQLWTVSNTPGEELNRYFGSEAADFSVSSNSMGLKNKIVDALINKITKTTDRQELVLHINVLDRILRALYFVVPHFNSSHTYVASWEKFGKPEWIPTERVAITAALNEWWIDNNKVKNLDNAMRMQQKIAP